MKFILNQEEKQHYDFLTKDFNKSVEKEVKFQIIEHKDNIRSFWFVTGVFIGIIVTLAIMTFLEASL